MLTQPAVAVVTDSTSYLPPSLVAELGVRIVALQVGLGGTFGAEGSGITPADVTAALRQHLPVTTSRPTPAEFGEMYTSALSAGAQAIVSVHLSAELSGTCDSARLAAAEFGDGVVQVIDSRSTGMGLGFAVIAAARAAAGGASAVEVADAARRTAGATSTLFYVDSLEWLHRGGRIGKAAALFGTALSVKPLLHLLDGRIVPLEKVRTASKAIGRLVQLAVTTAGPDRVDVAVQHLAAPERATELAARLRRELPAIGELFESEVGAVVGAHVGPGLLGIVISRCPRPR